VLVVDAPPTAPADEKKELLFRGAAIYEEILERPVDAIEVYKKVLEVDGEELAAGAVGEGEAVECRSVTENGSATIRLEHVVDPQLALRHVQLLCGVADLVKARRQDGARELGRAHKAPRDGDRDGDAYGRSP
jgi:hypothetical protein